MAVKTFPRTKDPNEIVDYGVNWADHLIAGDVITGSSWVGLPSGTLLSGPGGPSFTTTQTKVWLQGGDAGTDYTFVNRVTTQGGRTYDQSVKLKCRNR